MNNIQVSLNIDDIIEQIIGLNNKEKVHLIAEILDRFDDAEESPLQALAKHMHSQRTKEADNFKKMSKDNYWRGMGVAKAYADAADNFYKEAGIWKQFVDEKVG